MNITDSIVVSSSGWDEAGDYGDVQLYDAVLAIDTQKFKKGDKVETIAFLFSECKCQIYAKVGEKQGDCQPTEVIEEFSLTLMPVFN